MEDDVRSGPGGGGRDVDSEVLTSLEDKVRIGGLAIGYDLGRKGGVCRLRLRALMWFVGSIITSKQRKKQRFNQLVKRKNKTYLGVVNKKMHCDVVFPSGVGLVQPLTLAF